MTEQLELMKQELKAGTAQLLDVREFNEWKQGHLKQAIFASLSSLEMGDEPDADEDLKTYLHCRSGNRVVPAKEYLEEIGYGEVIDLREGFDQLVAYGFEEA